MFAVIFLALIAIVGLLLIFIIIKLRLRRASREVIRILKQQNAIDINNSLTLEELGIQSRGMMLSFFKGSDYRIHALINLIKDGTIKATEEGRLYLSPEKF